MEIELSVACDDPLFVQQFCIPTCAHLTHTISLSKWEQANVDEIGAMYNRTCLK